jgi:hypothetical protein
MPNAPMAGIPLLRPQRIPGGTMPIANNSLIGGFKNTSLASERLIADDPTHRHYSQHSNILAVWLDVVPRERQKEALERILSTSDAGFPASATLPAMTSATYYFRFYLARALAHGRYGRSISPIAWALAGGPSRPSRRAPILMPGVLTRISTC